MKILLDICHPAHAHFFKNPKRILEERGHQIVISARNKDCNLDLLDHFGWPYTTWSIKQGTSSCGRLKELLLRDHALLKFCQESKPDIMAAIGGTFIAHSSFFNRIPALVFYDSDNARMQNAITYPFANYVFVPRCYQSWLPKKRSLRYPGYHELSYLHPKFFQADREIAIANGLASDDDTFFIRTVALTASHDVGERGLDHECLRRLVEYLENYGKVIISTERALDDPYLEQHLYQGKVEDIHHVMAFCSAYIGDSATMASEAAILGVPCIYTSSIHVGTLDEVDKRYDLAKIVATPNWKLLKPVLEQVLKQPKEYWQQCQRQLLSETIDVATFVADCIEQFSSSKDVLQRKSYTADKS